MSAFVFTPTRIDISTSAFYPRVCKRPVQTRLRRPGIMRSLTLSVPGLDAAQLVDSSIVAKRARLSSADPSHCERLGAPLVDMIMKTDPDCSVEDVNIRVYQYYIPIYLWALELVENHKARSKRPLILGFSCPQGGGKTTMVKFLRQLFASDGMTSAGASIDDFYVPYMEQLKIASKNKGNNLLEYRGNPGTHDISLLCGTLDKIRSLNGPDSPSEVRVVKYDKTKYNGRGDRAPFREAEHIRNGLDVFLLEGWCLGFKAMDRRVDFVCEELKLVNKHLKDFDFVYDRLDGLLVIEVADLSCVYEWRAQPEREAIAAGKPGLSEEEVEDFVSRFMPSYEQYTPRLYSSFHTVLPGKELHIKINKKRQPVL